MLLKILTKCKICISYTVAITGESKQNKKHYLENVYFNGTVLSEISMLLHTYWYSAQNHNYQ